MKKKSVTTSSQQTKSPQKSLSMKKKKFSLKLEEDPKYQNKKKTVKVDARQNIRHKTGS